MSTIVNDEQRSWLDIYKSILGSFGYNSDDLLIDNKAPLRELELVSDEDAKLIKDLEMMKLAKDAGYELKDAEKIVGI